ncbi:MAG: phosphopentomutase [Firmicutes bacterium]|nr:phosphopentomutase [Bacillota bacterium]
MRAPEGWSALRDSAIDRVIIMVLDSLGVGAAPDAASYGDEGTNTLAHVASAVGGLKLPTLAELGLGNIVQVEGVAPLESASRGSWGRMEERSPGKDTTTGHWELCGLVLDKPFPTYPHGFPRKIIDAFEAVSGRKIIGNRAASGTQIVDELGAKHVRTGDLIVYTSADSVFQVAAHEEVVPPEELYAICIKARSLLSGEHAVGRVIARPFTGSQGSYKRTPRRRDFSLPPPRPTLLDLVVGAGKGVHAIGKVEDIFAGRGITLSEHTSGNDETVAALEKSISSRHSPVNLIMATCVDLDMLFGHRNDAHGYARALERLDRQIAGLIPRFVDSDCLIITADHGCDPTTPGTDHSREHVPVLVYGSRLTGGNDLGTRKSFADVAATVAQLLAVSPPEAGTSFAQVLLGNNR